MSIDEALEILQVRENAEPEVIEAAYKRLAAKYHPDRNTSPDAHQRLVDLNAAYAVLKNRRSGFTPKSKRTPKAKARPHEPSSQVEKAPLNSRTILLGIAGIVLLLLVGWWAIPIAGSVVLVCRHPKKVGKTISALVCYFAAVAVALLLNTYLLDSSTQKFDRTHEAVHFGTGYLVGRFLGSGISSFLLTLLAVWLCKRLRLLPLTAATISQFAISLAMILVSRNESPTAELLDADFGALLGSMVVFPIAYFRMRPQPNNKPLRSETKPRAYSNYKFEVLALGLLLGGVMIHILLNQTEPAPEVFRPSAFEEQPSSTSEAKPEAPESRAQTVGSEASADSAPIHTRRLLIAQEDLSPSEQTALNMACPSTIGLYSYRECVAHQLEKMKQLPRRPDLSRLSPAEEYALRNSCSLALSSGPASYNLCLLREMQKAGL